MNILYDNSGNTYTVMKVSQKAGYSFTYEMRPEFSGVPDSLVYYHDGSLHRFCPDGIQCGDQGKDLPADPFNKVGAYTFIVYEDAEWDCISPKGSYPHRVQSDVIEETGLVSGDVYISKGTWTIDQVEYTGPLLIQGLEETTAEGSGVLFHNITTVPLEG